MAANEIQHTQTVRGVVTPAFIKNGSFFFINLPVYENGIVDCWEAVDLSLLQEKLRQGWLRSSVPDGAAISIHGLGDWPVSQGQWFLDQDGLFQRVLSIVRDLNPDMRNLHDCHGETTQVIEGTRVAVLGTWSGTPVRSEKPRSILGRRFKGASRSIWLRSNEVTYLADLRVFANGKVELGRVPEPEVWTLEQLEQAAREGRLLTCPQRGERVAIDGLGSFAVGDPNWTVDLPEVLAEVLDLVESANGRPDSLARCRLAFDEYMEAPSVERREVLKVAYEAIPEHNRIFVGDMDTKDIPVRMIIYGDGEVENWSHRLVAKSQGLSLPTITVPRPPEKE
jgi:hypothetical protein